MSDEICIEFLPHNHPYVYCPEIYYGYISDRHCFQYDENSTFRHLCEWIERESGFVGNSFSYTRIDGKRIYSYHKDRDIEDCIHLYKNKTAYKVINKKIKLTRLLEILGKGNKLVIIWELQWPGGVGIGSDNGIRYIIHTDEKKHKHLPHVHVESGKRKIRIGLDPVEVLDDLRFKDPKFIRKAKEYVLKHRQLLLDEWNRIVIDGVAKVDIPRC